MNRVLIRVGIVTLLASLATLVTYPPNGYVTAVGLGWFEEPLSYFVLPAIFLASIAAGNVHQPDALMGNVLLFVTYCLLFGLIWIAFRVLLRLAQRVRRNY
jgi:hypothetical protein